MDRTYRTPRPNRTVTDTDGERYTQEFGRRAGLHTHRSQVTERRIRINRRDRHEVRLALRDRDWDVELRQPRGRAIRLAS